MRILIFLVLVIIGLSNQLNAQVCTPDPSVPKGANGVFPPPYDAATAPNGGIHDTVCLGSPFSFVFTVQVGDSITFGANRVALDSMKLQRTGGISELPTGIAYKCNPPSCGFASGTKGCVVLEGTANDKGDIGDKELTIKGLMYTGGTGFGLSISFPNALLAPGKYILPVRGADDSPCKGSGIDENRFAPSIAYKQGSQQLVIRFENQWNKPAQLMVYNAEGKTMYSKTLVGSSTIALNELNAGIYFYQVHTESGLYNGKFVQP